MARHGESEWIANGRCIRVIDGGYWIAPPIGAGAWARQTYALRTAPGRVRLQWTDTPGFNVVYGLVWGWITGVMAYVLWLRW